MKTAPDPVLIKIQFTPEAAQPVRVTLIPVDFCVLAPGWDREDDPQPAA